MVALHVGRRKPKYSAGYSGGARHARHARHVLGKFGNRRRDSMVKVREHYFPAPLSLSHNVSGMSGTPAVTQLFRGFALPDMEGDHVGQVGHRCRAPCPTPLQSEIMPRRRRRRCRTGWSRLPVGPALDQVDGLAVVADQRRYGPWTNPHARPNTLATPSLGLATRFDDHPADAARVTGESQGSPKHGQWAAAGRKALGGVPHGALPLPKAGGVSNAAPNRQFSRPACPERPSPIRRTAALRV